ncbi:hypothetical protein Q7P37_011262 [Cladosporium fusiforme]
MAGPYRAVWVSRSKVRAWLGVVQYFPERPPADSRLPPAVRLPQSLLLFARRLLFFCHNTTSCNTRLQYIRHVDSLACYHVNTLSLPCLLQGFSHYRNLQHLQRKTSSPIGLDPRLLLFLVFTSKHHLSREACLLTRRPSGFGANVMGRRSRSGTVANLEDMCPSSPELGTSSNLPPPTGSVPPRPRKRRRFDLSRLEELPTEITQAIFVQSGNLDLPPTSSTLTSLLSGKQLQWELTCNALSPVILRAEGEDATSEQLASASRLLNSRFMTWSRFRDWLDYEYTVQKLDVAGHESSTGTVSQSWYADVWRALCPSARLLPPSKVLHGPWTPDRVAFLNVFSLYPNSRSSPLDGIVAEVAHEGLVQAVEEQCLQVMKLLRNLHVQPGQDLLRKAVIDCGCDKEIVLYLLQWCVVEVMRWNAQSPNRVASQPRPDVDFLDPMLWAWTEKARNVGETKGEWLINILRTLSSLVTTVDPRELERLERDDSLYISQWQ